MCGSNPFWVVVYKERDVPRDNLKANPKKEARGQYEFIAKEHLQNRVAPHLGKQHAVSAPQPLDPSAHQTVSKGVQQLSFSTLE